MIGQNENTYSLEAFLNEGLSIRVYGRQFVPNLSVSSHGRSIGLEGQSLAFVAVRAFAVNSYCRRLPQPILIALPGEGTPPQAEDTCAEATDLVWKVPYSATSTALTPSSGTIEDILRQAELRGVDGGITLENPRISDGKACVDAHIWARIEIFGASASFNERFPICVPLQDCHTVWEIGWARLEVCFRAPRQICGKVTVGKWGIEKSWDYCVDLPISVANAQRECSCK